MKIMTAVVLFTLSVLVGCASNPSNHRVYLDGGPQQQTNQQYRVPGALVGAVAGGIVGSQFARGKEKGAATAVGALIGAGIGAEADASRNYVRGTYYGQPQYGSYANNPGASAAAARGASDRMAMEQRQIELQAYCSENPYARECQSGRSGYGYGYYGGGGRYFGPGGSVLHSYHGWR